MDKVYATDARKPESFAHFRSREYFVEFGEEVRGCEECGTSDASVLEQSVRWTLPKEGRHQDVRVKHQPHCDSDGQRGRIAFLR